MSSARIDGGFLIIPRKVVDGPIAHLPPHYREIYFWLLCRANFKDHQTNGKIIARGQLLCSYKEIAEGLHWYVGYRKLSYEKHHVEKAMMMLTKERLVATAKTTRGMIVTILNYEEMQDIKSYESDSDSDNKATIKRHDKETKENKRNIVVENAEQQNQISCLAEKLKSIVSTRENIKVTGHKLNGWKKSILPMLNQDGISIERIEKALSWYSENAGGEYVPVIESGKALREKFLKLEKAMQRKSRKNSRWDI